jgi:uncharacterized protein (TIGR03435 family)
MGSSVPSFGARPPCCALSRGHRRPRRRRAGTDTLRLRIGYGTLIGRSVTLKTLSTSMANFYGVGRLVVDRTGLAGGFDMDMEWAPMTQFRQPRNLDPPPDFADRAVNNLPILSVALREQLGLALEPDRGPVRSIVIEHVERPTPN